MARRKRSIKTELKRTAEFVSTPTSEIPGYKSSFKKGGVTYHIGDRVIAGVGDEAVEGNLTSVLGSQFTIHDPENAPYGKFFFYTGTKLVLLHSDVKPPKRKRRTKK